MTEGPRIRGTWSSLLRALSCVAAGSLVWATPQDPLPSPETPQPAPVARPIDSTPERAKAFEILRRARKDRALGAEVFAAELRGLGPDVIEPLLDVLFAHEVPPVQPDETHQTLSIEQREILLATLSSFHAARTLHSAELRLAAQPSAVARVAGLWVYSAVGDVPELARAVQLAHVERETKLPAKCEEAFRAAVTKILVRNPAGFSGLSGLVLRAPPELHRSFVFAIGDTRDPRGQETFARLLTFREDLVDVTVAQCRLLGPPLEPEVREELGRVLEPLLDSTAPQLCAAACRALGEIENENSIPRLIELLESTELTVRENALWALKRCSRLNLPPRAEAWSRWFREMQAWWDERAHGLFVDLRDGQRLERMLALEELGRVAIYRDEITDHVTPLLSDGDVLVRRRACDTLHALGMRSAAPALLTALEDSDGEVRSKARGALEALLARTLPDDPSECRRLLKL